MSILILLAFMISLGCHVDNRNIASEIGYFHTREKLVLDSFKEYVGSISTTEFPLESLMYDSGFSKNPIYTQWVYSDEAMQYFPAVLWQIYFLNGKSEWRQMADSYSKELLQTNLGHSNVNIEAVTYIYLNQYFSDRNEANKSSLLDLLTKYITLNEDDGALDCDSTIKTDRRCIEQLLENQILFIASDETGDPVYTQLAQQNSEYVFEHYFQNRQANTFYYDLANCENRPLINNLEQFNSGELYQLAVILYGFSILASQKGNERYQQLCGKLADIMSFGIEEFETETPADSNHSAIISQKMDMLTKVLVCLAFNKLSTKFGSYYQEMAEKIFNQILNTMTQTEVKNNEQYSFRLYYYLFEFLKQNH